MNAVNFLHSHWLNSGYSKDAYFQHRTYALQITYVGWLLHKWIFRNDYARHRACVCVFVISSACLTQSISISDVLSACERYTSGTIRNRFDAPDISGMVRLKSRQIFNELLLKIQNGTVPLNWNVSHFRLYRKSEHSRSSYYAISIPTLSRTLAPSRMHAGLNECRQPSHAQQKWMRKMCTAVEL